MRLIKCSIFYFSLCCLAACGSSNANPSDLFEIVLNGTTFQQNHNVVLALKNKKDIDISKVTYFLEGKELLLIDGKTNLNATTLGHKKIVAKVEYNDNVVEVSKNIVMLAQAPPKLYTYEILNEYPHDNKAFTQGLEFKGDTLYEGTGKLGRSSLRKVDFKTGKILHKIDLDNKVFGEGITIRNDTIYQLTWRNKIGYIYASSTFNKLDNFHYGESKEGWGLCHDDKKLYKSDGTDRIWFLDPRTLTEQGYIEIASNKSLFKDANELEYAHGKIYANVYQKSGVMIINPTSGAIEGVVNFGGLVKEVEKTPDWNDRECVLNGIAYHQKRKTFFVTGKNWNKLFEVKIIPK